MQFQHTCPECGEHENIGVYITVFLWPNRRKPRNRIDRKLNEEEPDNGL